MSQPKISVQLTTAMASTFTKATGLLKSMRNILVSDKAKAGVDRYVTELGIEPQKRKGGRGGGGGHPRNNPKKERRRCQAVSNFTVTLTNSGTISPLPPRCG
jgi:hypothetical protein